MHKKPLFVKLVIIILFGAGFTIAVDCADIITGKQISITSGLKVFTIIYMALISVLSFVAGIGMWRGKKWGWWLGAFLYMYAVLWTIKSLIYLPWLFGYFVKPHNRNVYYYIKHGINLVVRVLIFIYFFKGSVTEYFVLQQQSKIKTLIILFVLGLIVVVGCYLFLYYYRSGTVPR